MRIDPFHALAFGIGLGLSALILPTAIAQPSPEWPTRAVKVIVPLGPGSGTDVLGRLFADRLSARWNKPVVIENRPGGDGMIGIKSFLTAADDHMLLFTATSVFTGHPYLHDKLPYDPNDLVPAAQANITPVVVAVPTTLNVSSMKEFVDMARARPNALNAVAITGLQDLIFNAFLKSENLQISKVPYRDTVMALNDLAENRVHILLTSITIVQSQVQAGRVKIIATTSRQRQPVLPGTPTVSEAGFPSLTVEGGAGFFVPKTMNAQIRERIATDVTAVADADPTLRDRLAAVGQVLHTGPSSEFLKLVEDQRARAADAARILGIKPAEQ